MHCLVQEATVVLVRVVPVEPDLKAERPAGPESLFWAI